LDQYDEQPYADADQRADQDGQQRSDGGHGSMVTVGSASGASRPTTTVPVKQA
jgi:hypothetical protein